MEVLGGYKMKVIAILSVDEDVLNEVKEGDETTIDKVVSEFEWLHDSGITLDECHDLENSDIDNVTDEYQLLIWNKGKGEYSPVGRCQKTIEQCKQLAEVYLLYLSIADPHVYDLENHKICRRKIYTVYGNRIEAE